MIASLIRLLVCYQRSGVPHLGHGLMPLKRTALQFGHSYLVEFVALSIIATTAAAPINKIRKAIKSSKSPILLPLLCFFL